MPFKEKEDRKGYQSNWYANNKDHVAAYLKEYGKEYRTRPEVKIRNKAKGRAFQLRKLYGLTIEDYDKLLEAQDSKCAICGIDKRLVKSINKNGEEVGIELCVDHDHTTGRIRGLLCHGCNVIEGNIRRSGLPPEEFARKLSEYLNKT